MDTRWLDVSYPRPPGDRERFRRVVRPRGDDRSLRGASRPVACPPHPLEESGDLAGTLVLDDVIDPADVDAQFHRGRTEESVDLAGLEAVFDLDPGGFRERAVMDADIQIEFVEPRAQGFCGLTGVDEDQRRLVRRDDVADRPDVARDARIGH